MLLLIGATFSFFYLFLPLYSESVRDLMQSIYIKTLFPFLHITNGSPTEILAINFVKDKKWLQIMLKFLCEL